ncbi:MAG: dihydroorotate dehydrogenase electron transfer subunit [Pirellulales bacterium]
MNSTGAVPCFADRAVQQTVEVIENRHLAHDTYRIRIGCPALARRIVPGQFVMLRLADCDDPLLGRPLALYDTVFSAGGEPIGIDIVYLVMGKMTARLAQYRPGQTLDVWGPLGNGFPPQPVEHLIMVAGGIGQTPFMAVGREYLGLRSYGEPARTVAKSAKVTLCYGVRRAEYLAGLDDFRAIGIDVRVSTDDGSAGRHGFVTELLRDLLKESEADVAGGRCRIVCCGPEKMMEAVAHIGQQAGVPCQVSLETPMACGIGICFSCVTKVRQADGEWDYRRTCVEGPVFEAEQIVW